MKRVKWIICALCILFPVFLLFICGVMLIGVSDESEDGDPVHASGLGLSDKVREYAAFVGDTAAEYNIHEYENSFGIYQGCGCIFCHVAAESGHVRLRS